MGLDSLGRAPIVPIRCPASPRCRLEGNSSAFGPCPRSLRARNFRFRWSARLRGPPREGPEVRAKAVTQLQAWSALHRPKRVSTSSATNRHASGSIREESPVHFPSKSLSCGPPSPLKASPIVAGNPARKVNLSRSALVERQADLPVGGINSTRGRPPNCDGRHSAAAKRGPSCRR